MSGRCLVLSILGPTPEKPSSAQGWRLHGNLRAHTPARAFGFHPSANCTASHSRTLPFVKLEKIVPSSPVLLYSCRKLQFMTHFQISAGAQMNLHFFLHFFLQNRWLVSEIILTNLTVDSFLFRRHVIIQIPSWIYIPLQYEDQSSSVICWRKLNLKK